MAARSLESRLKSASYSSVTTCIAADDKDEAARERRNEEKYQWNRLNALLEELHALECRVFLCCTAQNGFSSGLLELKSNMWEIQSKSSSSSIEISINAQRWRKNLKIKRARKKRRDEKCMKLLKLFSINDESSGSIYLACKHWAWAAAAAPIFEWKTQFNDQNPPKLKGIHYFPKGC